MEGFTIYSWICVNELNGNFVPQKTCSWETGKIAEDNEFYFWMECGEKFKGINGAKKCNQFYDQILSTFKFLK